MYALIDSRNGQIFYIGKGKGARSSMHVKEALRGIGRNAVKSQRILDVMSTGGAVHERIFMNCNSEAKAYAVERSLIGSWRSVLTNIASGTVTQEENNVAQIERDITRLRTFDEWVDSASDAQLHSAAAIGGSPEKFYADFLDGMFRLLEKARSAIAVNNHGLVQ